MRPYLSFAGNLRTLVLSSSIMSLFTVTSLSATGQCPGPGIQCPELAPGVPGGVVMCRIQKIQADITPWIKSYMEIKPVDYETNPTRKYPLLVYLGGTGEQHQVPNNNTVELCKVLYWSMPSRINAGQFPNEVVHNGQSYSYFVVMPFLQVGNSHQFDPIDPGAMIDYVLAHYPGRIDVNRIYLTGMSRGTEYIMGWLSQSVNNARRIAAAYITANCFPDNLPDFNQRVSNLAASDIHLWGLSCSLDAICSPTAIQAYVNGVNAQNPGHAIYTSYTDPPPPPPPGIPIVYCPGGFAGFHYAWNFGYSPDENRPPETGNKNPYEWMIQFSQNISLPVILKDWRARLDRGHVLLEWTTSQEFNTKEFVIQRSTISGNFENILSIPAAIASSTERRYSLVDDRPLPGQSLYRLVLIDQDGKQEIFPIKKIVVPSDWTENVIIPNPVDDGILNIYTRVDRAQRISIRLLDITGRLLQREERQSLAGDSQYQISVASLQKGTYLVQIIGEDFKKAKKITID